MKGLKISTSFSRYLPKIVCLISFLIFSNGINAAHAKPTDNLAKATRPLRIAVAANFAPVLKKLLPEFTAKTQIETQMISGATGTLYLQIKHGAPFDIFLAADSVRPQRLVAQQLTISDSIQTYAVGQLALWSATDEMLTLSSLQKTPARFAIANPNTAPYGKAAKEVLEHLKLWHSYQQNLVMGININQTFQQIRSQAVSIGIVANSQLKLNNLTGTIIPENYHQPIEQQLVILASSHQAENAEKLSQFLLNKAVQQQIVGYGYQVNRVKEKLAVVTKAERQ